MASSAERCPGVELRLADALALAREIDLPMLKTPYTMFEACARLYTAGLRPVELG